MAFDCFTPFGVFEFSSDSSQCEKQYDALVDSLGPFFDGPVQEAHVYAQAMGIGCALLQKQGAEQETKPLECVAMLDEAEHDYQIIPTFGQSVNERQFVLATAVAAQAGALESIIEAGLTAMLGTAFVGWRAFDSDTEVTIAAGDNSDVNWITETPTVTTAATQAAATGVCWGQFLSRWIAVTATATTTAASYSDDDGVTWTPVTTGYDTKAWASICHYDHSGANNYVAVCQDPTSAGSTQSVMTSDTGETWTIRTALAGSYNKVLNVANQITAIGDGVAMHASNPATWFADTISAHNWKSFAHGNDVWVAVSTDGYVCTAPNGKDWSAAAVLAGTWQDITYGDGIFVAVSSTGTYRAKWSADGVTWNNCTIETRDYFAITFCDGLFVTAATSGSSYSLCTSDDGKTWALKQWLVTSHQWNSMASKPNKIVGVANSTAAFAMHVFPVPHVSPDRTPIKHVRLTEQIWPGVQSITYESILDDGNPLMVGEYLTVEPGRLGRQERVQILASSTTQILATFVNAHGECRATTAPWPTWRSTKRHSLVIVTAATLTNRTKLAQIQVFMRKIMPAAATWTVCATSPGVRTPFLVGTGKVGFSTLGGFIEADPS
jgi:hypothetical protein